jgi:hypothetical protein
MLVTARGVIGKAYYAISLPPTLRKNREGWGNHSVVVSAESWASPPPKVSVERPKESKLGKFLKAGKPTDPRPPVIPLPLPDPAAPVN